ncbi:MAG: cadmium-containing carbonic anhydrase [Nitrosomonas sp.]|uniref:cadmium-containing carbonic anhydrase n=1 Tax=Nitrosomonas sp. TaxID=42353 RepID=UPI0025FBDB82|nr:cadmium-containing carbonic anhydrase [Nitrosomonas sp.]MBY0475352.1 cadmium-containing carbonic anhydrase [Nitrosomonas sp.]
MFESLKNLLKHFTGSQESTSGISTQDTISSAADAGHTQYITLGQFNLGTGSIGPDNRNDIDQNILNQMYRAIASGLFNVPVNNSIPEICVDGRTNKNGYRKSAPCAAGGTLSIVYGGDLGSNSAATDINEVQLTTQTINKLKEKGHQAGVHGDDHSDCGCGACSKAPTIYQHITERINDLSSLTNQLGINITESEKESIVQQAKNRLSQAGFFAENRASVVQAAQDSGADYEELVGQHNELGIALNTRVGTTVDRSAIRSKYGPQYDMFVVDAWTFGNAAKDINSTGNEADEQRIAKAITLQNVATASVLGHGSLPIIPIA